MKKIVDQLCIEGYDAINWVYPSKKATIEQHAQALVSDLCNIAKSYPHDDIYFITHSMGGLVVRSALNHPHCPMQAKCGKAIFIAPPHQGSTFARKLNAFPIVQRWLGKHAGRQLLTTERGGFEKLGPFPDSLDILIIAGDRSVNPFLSGPNDGKVLVWETRIQSLHKFMQVHAGHTWITYHPEVIENVRIFLENSN